MRCSEAEIRRRNLIPKDESQVMALYESAKILIENGVEVDVLIGEYLDPLILVAAKYAKFNFVELMITFTRYINRRDSNELNLMIYLMRSEQEHYSFAETS